MALELGDEGGGMRDEREARTPQLDGRCGQVSVNLTLHGELPSLTGCLVASSYQATVLKERK